jgi:hypothetical protein
MTGAPDSFEAAFVAGAVRALRNRAAALKARASVGVTILDRRPPVRVVTSESATDLRIADSWESIADEMERSR